ncbi:hypothetical protein PybrP1_008761 [[Pythium] brassicae (nom. inval.)]|nr:hypothetical protein PybrP1_008761 [[Pythium] brassicae (nom. inval.)]
MPIDVTARHAFAYSGRQLQLADEHTMVFVSGNALAFTSTVSNSQHFLLRPKPRELVAFDCNWRTATVAVTAREPSPDILLYSYPDKKLRGKLQRGARFEYSRLAFSRCGRRLVSLRPIDSDEGDEGGTAFENAVAGVGGGGLHKPPFLPAPNANISNVTSDAGKDGSDGAAKELLLAKRQRVCVWDIERFEPIKGCESGALRIDAAFVSFNPANADLFVVGGDDGLQIWKIFCGKRSSLLRHVSVHPLDDDHSVAFNGDDNELFELEEKRGQWLCHAWVKNDHFLAANRAGELALIDAGAANVVQLVDSAVHPTRSCIAAIVYTAASVVLSYADGRVLWLDEKNWEVLQTSSLPESAAASEGQESSRGAAPSMSTVLGSDMGIVACMAASPNHSKIYIGTREGGIFELKSSVATDDEDDEDGASGLATSPSADPHSNNTHLVVPCGSFHVGAVLASSALTPSGGAFLSDVLIATGGVSGRLYLWSVSKCRLMGEAGVAQLFASAPGSVDISGLGATGSSGGLIGAAPPADPMLLIGDQTGRLRALCVAKVVGGANSGAVEFIPLHSVQLASADAPLDRLEVHPTQTVALAASTRDSTVFFVSLEPEKHFPVLAYFALLEPDERTVDVRWSLPAHNRSALTATCFSSRGLFYVARFHPTSSASDDPSARTPLEIKPKLVAFGEDVLPECAGLHFLGAAPTSMMLASSPSNNHLHVMKYMEMGALDPSDKISILSKVLAPDAHESGIATMALYPRALLDGSELVATAGMNGVITIWLVAFGAACSGTSASSGGGGGGPSASSGAEWQLEDVLASKKKSVATHSGPVTSLLFLDVGEDVFLVSTGGDGCVFLLDMRIPSDSQAPLSSPREMHPNPLYINLASFAKYDDVFKPAQELERKPFLQVLRATEELHARSRFDRLKDQTRAQLNDLELKLKLLLAENDKLPESERLTRDEFVVNVDWRDQILRRNRERADRVREGIVRDLAKMSIVRERMKREFWDSATVQGVCLRGLSPTPASSASSSSGSAPSGSVLFVYNFPMRRQSKHELRTARQVELMRAIEFAHEQQEAAHSPASTSTLRETAHARFLQVLPPSTSGTLQWLIDAGLHHPSLNRWLADKSKNSSVEGGSAGELQSHLLVYHPAAVRTRKQQRVQIQLLKAFVRSLVVEFNAEFTALARLKETKIDEIEAKNARIAEICAELGGAPELFRPQLALDERAASILEVSPDEMTHKVHETEEMRRRREREAQEKLELERQRQRDDVTGRALRDMMDGTLEVKKESLAVQTLVKEQWMLDTSADEMTGEQKKLVAQFEAAQQKFLEERDKYRKSLDLELKKSRGEIGDICRAFDDKLRALHESYLLMRRSVLVQHLYELRLAEDLMDHEQLLLVRQRIAAALEELHADVKASEHESELFALQLESAKDEWHRAADDDKSCEKNFLRELEELVVHSGGVLSTPLDHDLVKHLVELFKKRKADDVVRSDGDSFARKAGATAKRGKSSQHLGMGASSASLTIPGGGVGATAKQRLLAEGLASDPSSRSLAPVTSLLRSLQHSSSDGVEGEANLDPFQYVDTQPQTPLRRVDSGGVGGGDGGQRHVVPLDYDVDRPDGILIEDRVWRALNALRTKKILAEHTAREKAEQLALAKGVAEELHAKLGELQFAAQEQAAAFEAASVQLDALAENSPLLVHIKQGQDESGSSSMDTDDLFRCAAPDSFLVARASVEALNDVIQLHGRDQVSVLSKIKNFRKNINVMEWEHTLLQLQTKDMEERYTDIQLLRVTKDLQELFHTGDTTEKQQREIALLEAKMGHLGRSHQTNLLKLDETMGKLQRQLRERERENDGFEQQVQRLQMQVQIREDILASRKTAALRNAAAASSAGAGGGERESPQLKAIIVRRKLVDLAKAQTEEIEYLRLELDKMRRRTFPSFVQHVMAHEYRAADSK